MDAAVYLLISLLFLVSIYLYKTWTYNYWKNFNVPSLPNRLPFFGHALPVVLGKKNLGMLSEDIYKGTLESSGSMCGLYYMSKPSLLICDPKLVKKVFVSNFSSFHTNEMQVDPVVDPVLAKNPFFCSGEAWKESRLKIISNFTGRKARHLFDIIGDVANNFGKYINRKIEENHGFLECELKELLSRYTGEIVANAALGIEGCSFQDRPGKSSFKEMTKILFQPTRWQQFQHTIKFFLPRLGDLLGIGFMPRGIQDYFRNSLDAIIEERKRSVDRPKDYLEFVLESNKNESAETKMLNVIAEIMSFFVDTYETSSLTMSYMFYHVAKNKEVQDKLREEISETLARHDRVLTYEALKELRYLDKVIFETLRLNSANTVFMKECSEEIRMEGEDGSSCIMKPGQVALISTAILHLNEKNFREPNKFLPERFDETENERDANEKERVKFLPFGDGPRVCPGQRLATMLIKLATVKLLTNFSLEPSSKTKTLEMEAGTVFAILQYPKDGIWIKFKPLE